MLIFRRKKGATLRTRKGKRGRYGRRTPPFSFLVAERKKKKKRPRQASSREKGKDLFFPEMGWKNAPPGRKALLSIGWKRRKSAEKDPLPFRPPGKGRRESRGTDRTLSIKKKKRGESSNLKEALRKKEGRKCGKKKKPRPGLKYFVSREGKKKKKKNRPICLL